MVLPRIAAAVAATIAAFVMTITVTACSPASETVAEKSDVRLPDSAAGDEARWLLDVINSDDEPDASEVEKHLGAEMKKAVATKDLVTVFNQMRGARPWKPTNVDDRDVQLVVTLESTKSPAVDMQLALDASERISGLFFAPVSEKRTPARSWDEITRNIRAVNANISMTVTEVTGEPRSILDLAGDASLPLGSVFKLYVLGAVADAVQAGSLSWDDELTLTDDVRSVPSGELQDEPTGTTVSVREAAEKMISISDNTATDMLIAAVGRESVEAAMAEMGHHDPSLNTPFLTTRELFQLGWGNGTEARDQWADASASERSALLTELPGGVIDIDASAVTDAVWTDDLDWFASGDDLVAAHLALQERAETKAGSPLRGILGKNPGLEFGKEWTYVAFKGGSVPGVLAGSWYLERADGDCFVVTIQGASTDPAVLADTRAFFGHVEDAVALLKA